MREACEQGLTAHEVTTLFDAVLGEYYPGPAPVPAHTPAGFDRPGRRPAVRPG